MAAPWRWGVPDWRDGSAYPTVESKTRRQWYWEFLRRRPDYRAEWLLRFGAHRARMLAADLPPDRLEYELAKIRIFEEPEERLHRYRRTYLLQHVIDPALECSDRYLMHAWKGGEAVINYPADANDMPEDAVISIARSEATERRVDDENHLVQISFDLRRPLAEQLRRAKDILECEQEYRVGAKVNRKPNTSEWPLYLRALDAADDGATFGQMASAFWPELNKSRQSARDTYKQALRVRDFFPI
jgi:hypothetical protein